MFKSVHLAQISKASTVAIFGLCASLPVVAPAQADDQSPYFGRWTFDGKNQKFSHNGILYKTIDVGPCGKDFCGISVSDKGECGVTLFRFLTEHAKNDSLEGHGLWGKEKKYIQIYMAPKDSTNAGSIHLDLGDSADINSREGSGPKFFGDYRISGPATCAATS